MRAGKFDSFWVYNLTESLSEQFMNFLSNIGEKLIMIFALLVWLNSFNQLNDILKGNVIDLEHSLVKYMIVVLLYIFLVFFHKI